MPHDHFDTCVHVCFDYFSCIRIHEIDIEFPHTTTCLSRQSTDIDWNKHMYIGTSKQTLKYKHMPWPIPDEDRL